MKVDQETILHAAIHQDGALEIILESLLLAREPYQYDVSQIMLKACLKNSAEQLERKRGAA